MKQVRPYQCLNGCCIVRVQHRNSRHGVDIVTLNGSSSNYRDLASQVGLNEASLRKRVAKGFCVQEADVKRSRQGRDESGSQLLARAFMKIMHNAHKASTMPVEPA